ncbi:unnamed protein product [Cylindrotheca closterium]|uniref:Protein kinase domain-containing protein n=1 Tax=Cylindrotheca closterium TaxID=2856 RepID=A0AAD2G5H8_9STRA|nr:unnamed protein product [Cylindrotheca closterium]
MMTRRKQTQFQLALMLILQFVSLQTTTVGAFQSSPTGPNNPSSPAHQMVATTSGFDTTESSSEDASTIDFPPPLSPIQRTARALKFYKQVLPVLGAYKVKEFELELRRKQLKQEISEEEEASIWKEIDEWGSARVADTIQDMKGFYVKTGQVISTRVDLFPEAYTSKLQDLQDGLDPMPFALVKKVVEQELLDGAPLSELFATFEEEPLGAASIAQVHKATLLDGRVVAVKLQRPNVEPKLLGDVANLKRISKALADNLPVDYYTVFCELGDALNNELNFLAEAQAMRKIDLAISHDEQGQPTQRAVSIPLPIGELVSKRVLVMDFVEGVPLNKLKQRMKEKGIEEGTPEAKLAGRRILDSLSLAFGRMIFGAGFLHGDPHPGNIFIGEGGKVSLIDCGQFKALPRPQRVRLAEVVLAVADYQDAAALVAAEQNASSDSVAKMTACKDRLATLVQDFGVTVAEENQYDTDLWCSIGLFLFGNADQRLPGNGKYSANELDDNSPIKLVTSFPQELVLLGRATVLLKGIAKKLEVPFSLADKWGPGCALTLEAASEPTLPLWGKETAINGGEVSVSSPTETPTDAEKIRFLQVMRVLKTWGKGKGRRFLERVVRRLPPNLKAQVLEAELRRQERKEREMKENMRVSRQ